MLHFTTGTVPNLLLLYVSSPAGWLQRCALSLILGTHVYSSRKLGTKSVVKSGSVGLQRSALSLILNTLLFLALFLDLLVQKYKY